MWSLISNLNLQPLKRRVGRVVIGAVVLAGCMNTAMAMFPRAVGTTDEGDASHARTVASRY